jgi:hypothetical protein
LSQILSAVQDGNLTAAQQALGALQSTSATYGPPPAGSSSTSSAGSSVQSVMRALIAAVSSGNTTAAQQALTQLQTAMKADSGHHHHHHGSGSSSASSSTTLSASTSDSTQATGSGASAAVSGGKRRLKAPHGVYRTIAAATGGRSIPACERVEPQHPRPEHLARGARAEGAVGHEFADVAAHVRGARLVTHPTARR